MTTSNHLNEFVQMDPKTLEDHSKTADELLKVEHLDCDNTEYLAKLLFCLGRYDESIQQFERILELKGNEKTAMVNIAINHFKKGDYTTAIEYLKKFPDDEMALKYRMLSHEFLNEFRSAIDCGRMILKISPKNGSVIKRMIDYHFELEEYDTCLKYMKRIDYDDHERKLLILYMAEKYEECIEFSRKAKTTQSHLWAGRSYHKLNNNTKAVRYLYKAYEKDLDVDILFEISDICFKDRDPARAISFLKRALVHDESYTDTLCRIADAYLSLSKWPEAIEYAKKALEITRKVPKAYIVLADAYLYRDLNHEKGKEIVAEGLRENPESSELWVKQGSINSMDNDVIFHESYEKAISLNPMDCKIHREYIDLLLMGEEYETAKKWYNQLLLINPLFEKSFEDLQWW